MRGSVIMVDRSKKIFFSKHARLKMVDRGTSEEEVIGAIKEGSFELTCKGRFLFRKNLSFNGFWRTRRYLTKQIAPVIVEEEDKLVIVTVYVYYF